jgi:hypothetical protein
MKNVTTKLSIVASPLKGASVLRPEELPALTGVEPEDLICGGCGSVVEDSISAITMKSRFDAPNQLILVCPACSSNNVLPSTLIQNSSVENGPEPGQGEIY